MFTESGPAPYTVRMAEPKSSEDLPFRHYTLRNRLVAWISTHIFDGITYRVAMDC
jgi:hypothetical protein